LTGRTHLLGGIASVTALHLIPGAVTAGSDDTNIGLLALIAGIGALLPDLDARHSTINHWKIGGGIEPLALPSLLIYRAFGHRGLLHSLAGWGIASVCFSLPLLLWLGWQPASALSLGYLSHLLLDGCTKTGVPLWYPHPRRVWVLPTALRVTTGSAAEEVVLVLLAMLCLGLFLSVLGGVPRQ